MNALQLGQECLLFLKLSMHNGRHEQKKHLEKMYITYLVYLGTYHNILVIIIDY